MFQLVDSILPFEACLYHQVLPMYVEGSRLSLGMVNPDDTTALDYVRRLVAYINCSLVPRKISSEVHQTMLSAYLSYADKKKQAATKARLSPPKPAGTNRNDQATLIVDSPEELDPGSDNSIAQADIPRKARSVKPDPTPADARSSHPSTPPAKGDHSTEEAATFVLKSDQPATAPGPKVSVNPGLPRLEVVANHLYSPIEVLSVLPPKHLLNELLARVLAGGIGRLFFERQEHQGRILWSQDGVLQSVLEGLEPALFQGVINELKRLTELPQLTVQKPRQVEIERLYEETRLVLRFRVMPGRHGEEATLQVLRGAALKFHQQQQLATLGRDALGIAQQLQRKLSELSNQAQAEPLTQASQLDSLDALRQMLKSMNQQLQALDALRTDGEGNNRSSPSDS